MTYSNWDESEHPRDDIGRFTYKNGGSTSFYEKHQQENQKIADILYPTMKDKNEKTYKKEGFEKYFPLKNYIDTQLGGDVAKYLKNNMNGDAFNKNKDFENTKNSKIDNTVFSGKEIARARVFIQKIEGFRENAYQDTGGVWTIGYGRTENVRPGDRITKEEAEELFISDFNKYKNSLREVKIPLTTNEKIALASFAYNIGPSAFKNSTLLKKLNQGDKQGAANEFDKWIYDDNVVVKGLINRRKQEKELFLTPDN